MSIATSDDAQYMQRLHDVIPDVITNQYVSDLLDVCSIYRSAETMICIAASCNSLLSRHMVRKICMFFISMRLADYLKRAIDILYTTHGLHDDISDMMKRSERINSWDCWHCLLANFTKRDVICPIGDDIRSDNSYTHSPWL